MTTEQLAKDLLAIIDSEMYVNDFGGLQAGRDATTDIHAAMAKLQASLAQPAQQEPFTHYRHYDGGLQEWPDEKTIPLYTTPPQTKQEQKPVAWLEPEWGEKICPEVGYEVTMTDDHPKDLCWIPLYPKHQLVGLTDEQIDALALDDDGLPNSHWEFAKAIEAAHGIGKNT